MRAAAVAAVVILATAGSAASQGKPAGYLAEGAHPDGIAILPPPPAADSSEQAAERQAYERTRALEGSPRWALAVTDADLKPPGVYRGYACAAGVEISPETTPTVHLMLQRTLPDISRTVSPAKDRYQRPRPAVGNDRPICVARDPTLMNNGSYPSGHALLGWAWGLILAELVPARADALLTRGRELGDSRLICGVHFASDIEAGRTLGSALVARLHAEPAFQADLAKAREELARAPPAKGC
jgi:acid phosphatase (class A)